MQIINPTIGTRPDQPLCQGSGLTLLHRVEGNSPHWGEHWCATEYTFASNCTHLHIYSMQLAQKHTYKHDKHIYRAYIYVFQAPYVHICPAYMHIWPYIALHSVRAAYIYIYTEQDLEIPCTSHAAGSCSQHGITIHRSPPEATIGFLSRNISIAQGTV